MSKSMKWIVAALALSLAVNVFVIGVAIGKRIVSGSGGSSVQTLKPVGPGTRGMNLRALGEYLNEEEQEQARQILMDHRDFLRENGRSIRRVEQDVRDLISAETVDVDMLYAKIAELESLKQDTNIKAQSELLGFVATLDVETRQVIAQNLFRRPPGPEANRGRPPRFRDRRPPRGERGRPPPPDGF